MGILFSRQIAPRALAALFRNIQINQSDLREAMVQGQTVPTFSWEPVTHGMIRSFFSSLHSKEMSSLQLISKQDIKHNAVIPCPGPPLHQLSYPPRLHPLPCSPLLPLS
jgi:hypothetical protein